MSLSPPTCMTSSPLSSRLFLPKKEICPQSQDFDRRMLPRGGVVVKRTKLGPCEGMIHGAVE